MRRKNLELEKLDQLEESWLQMSETFKFLIEFLIYTTELLNSM